MGERRGTKGLELWCRRMTEGYPGVNVTNMTTSWRDGLAFCAIIHHFRPDLIEFSKLNKDDIYYNNELAFRIAERHLGIPALLEPEDMVEFPVPDRLSILTYLSQFYQTFVVAQGSTPSRIAPKRSATSPDHGIVSPASTSPPTKVAFQGAGKIRREPCAKCGLPVFIAERLNVGKLLYHRTCFRCARCNSQLTLANYYETENNEFCCETCPDEETNTSDDPNKKTVLNRSLSDEEKSASLKKFDETDDYSAEFEVALENSSDSSLKRDSTLNCSEFSKARSFFINSQVDTNSDNNSNSADSGNEEEEPPPDPPNSKPPIKIDLFGTSENSSLIASDSSVSHYFDSGFPSNRPEASVNSGDNNSRLRNDASLDLDESHDIVTKDNSISAEGNGSLSLVKARMRLFETNTPQTNKSDNVANETQTIPELSLKIFGKTATPEKQSFEENNVCNKEEEAEEIKLEDNKSTPEDNLEEVIDNKDLGLISSTIPKEIRQEESSPLKSPKNSEIYPEDLNPFGEDDESSIGDKKNKKESLNPFEDDEDEEIAIVSPKPAVRRKNKQVIPETATIQRSSNPFEDDDEENEDGSKESAETPQPAKRLSTKKVIAAPNINLNPFWSDDEENHDKPVPKPRMSKTSPITPESNLRQPASLNFDSSNVQFNFVHTLRKKKPAPKPPLANMSADYTESEHSSLTSSPCHSVPHSPRCTPKTRKLKKAPPPPSNFLSPLKFELENDFLEQDKILKDELNRTTKQSQMQSPTSSDSSSLGAPNKSTFGKWKRRKGQAPSRPIPQRRHIKSLPTGELKRELEVIEIQQQGLEKQGVRLEQMIRDQCEGPDSNLDEALAPEVEDLVLQLFELVNEKNELFRKQAELMYLRRQQRLEEEHADVEYQIRCLMLQPEANKTDSDKAREEELINRLVEIVERRNEIIECLEMDRVREAEEDDSINNQLNLYTLKKEDRSMSELNLKKDKKKHKKEKRFKLKGHKIDADKDIDECETTSNAASSRGKEKKKKKFHIF